MNLTHRELPPPRVSIQSCLVSLGAALDEVYKPKSLRPGKQNPTGKTLRERYSLVEIYEWGKSLYRDAIRRAHPDSGGCHETAVRLNCALNTLKRLCRVG